MEETPPMFNPLTYQRYVESIDWETIYQDYLQAHHRVRLPSISRVVPPQTLELHKRAYYGLVEILITEGKEVPSDMKCDIMAVNDLLIRIRDYKPLI